MWKADYFTPYVIQIGQNSDVLYVNFATKVTDAYRRFLRRHPRLKQSKLRRDLFDDSLTYRTSKRALTASLRLINQLEATGYEVIAGGPLHNPYWQVYVIEIEGDPRHLYVGQTNYPVEKRFQQHIYKFNSARALLKYDNLALAMEYCHHLPKFRHREGSLHAEASLAKELREEGIDVEGGT